MKRHFVIAIAALVTIVAAPILHAADASPTHQQFLKDYYALYNAQGASQLERFYADDAVFTDPSFELDLHGRDAIGKLLTAALAKYTTLDHQVLNAITAGDELIVEGLMVAELRGKPLKVRFVSVFKFRAGKIVSQHDLYDLRHYQQQMGSGY